MSGNSAIEWTGITWLYTLFEQTFGEKNCSEGPTSSKKVRYRMEQGWNRTGEVTLDPFSVGGTLLFKCLPFEGNSIIECLKRTGQYSSPFIHVPIPFRAIAGRTGRYDVIWSGDPSFANRMDMIPCGGRPCRTIGTQTIKLCQNLFLSIWRNRSHIPFAGMGMLASLSPIGSVCGVSLPRFLVDVYLAQAPSYVVSWQPIFAGTTIGQSQKALALSFRFPRTLSGTGGLT
jgi:hypothetical protein